MLPNKRWHNKGLWVVMSRKYSRYFFCKSSQNYFVEYSVSFLSKLAGKTFHGATKRLKGSAKK